MQCLCQYQQHCCLLIISWFPLTGDCHDLKPADLQRTAACQHVYRLQAPGPVLGCRISASMRELNASACAPLSP
jgi:hypothetical protein